MTRDVEDEILALLPFSLFTCCSCHKIINRRNVKKCQGVKTAGQFKKLEKEPEGRLLDLVKSFVNQTSFLLHQARLDNVSSKGVEFVDGNGYHLPVEELSDGYRFVLSMTFELIRQLARAYGSGRVFDPEDSTKVIAPGVVLVDEIDAHLHPTWQRRIGIWFREHFPNLQFTAIIHGLPDSHSDSPITHNTRFSAD